MPYEEEEDRGCEVKCPKGGGVCSRGSTAILLPIFVAETLRYFAPLRETTTLRMAFVYISVH